MAVKTFYSTEDIEALVAQGRTELVLDENIVLTELARDTANRLGLRLVTRPGTVATSPAGGASPVGTAAAVLANKPKGCQHGPLPSHAPAPTEATTNPEGIVGELVGLVKKLGHKNTADRGDQSQA